MSVGAIIGGSGGIGSACARALCDSVEVMVLVGRNKGSVRDIADQIGSRTAVEAVLADITAREGRDKIIDKVTALGPLSWVVFAAGIPQRNRFTELSEDEIETAFLANLVAPALLLRRLLDCTWQRSGAIVVIGSISSSRALAKRAVYGAAKAGVEHLCRSLAVELYAHGIRINVVAPGVIETEFLPKARSELDEWISDHVPVGRAGYPNEVAEVVRYVLLEAPEYLHGARVVVDGGAEAVG